MSKGLQRTSEAHQWVSRSGSFPLGPLANCTIFKKSRVPGDTQDFGLICSFLTKEIISREMEDTSEIITEWASSGRSDIPATEAFSHGLSHTNGFL